jgi:RND family efflux transporter MFP subunit
MTDFTLSCRFLVGFLALAVFQTGCAAPEEDITNEQNPPLAVQAVILRPGPYDQVYEAAGTVRARQRAVLASKLQGTVLAVHAKLGDAVSAGQLLAEIDHREVDAEVGRMEAMQAATEEALVQAKSALQVAETEVGLAVVTSGRYQELFEKRSVSRQELDEIVAREKVAQATLASAQARLQESEAHQKVSAAALAAARVRQDYHRIAAPFVGLIVEQHADVGTLAMPGMPLFTLDESQGYRLEVSVPETHLAAVKLGVSAKVSIPSIQLDSEGRIVEIEPAAEPGSHSSLVRISLPAVEGLRSGLFGRGILTLGAVELLTVPLQAVLRQGQLVSVFVHQDGTARRRLIAVGRQFGDALEVLSGVSAGDEVITSDLDRLTDGSPVEVRP